MWSSVGHADNKSNSSVVNLHLSQDSTDSPESTGSTKAMDVWYDCLLLKDRTLTDREKETLNSVNVKSVSRNGVDVMIGPNKDSPFIRPMHVELTHYHHLEALLAMVACYVDPTVQSLYEHPVRHVQRAAAQRVVHSRDPLPFKGRRGQE